MLGYEVLAQSLAKQGIQHTYGIIGICSLTKESQSLNLASLSNQ